MPRRQPEPPRIPRYIPLFWRIFIPNATVLGVAGIVLAAEPANGRVAVLLAGFATMLGVNLAIMRRSFAPLGRLAALMRDVDPLRPGQRIPVLGPPSEVTLVTEAFNDMLERLEHERRDSARRELSAQQAVRRHVARELHDELGQDLTALALHLDRLAAGTVPDAQASAAEARDGVLQSVDTVRRLASQLRPEVLDDLGLRPAINDLCDRLTQRTGLNVKVELGPLPERLDPDTELVIFRVVQESLTNVLRHAEASRASVRVRHSGDEVIAEVTDDGRGMAVNGDGHQGGLRQMRERALLVGGRLELESPSQAGTRVRLRVPVQS